MSDKSPSSVIVNLASAGIHAMHDLIEGGLSGALYELAETAGVDLAVEADAIRLLPEVARFCAEFNLGPFCAIASGAQLICIDPAVESSMVRRLRRARVPVARIGAVVERSNGVTLVQGGRERRFPRFAVDELTRVRGLVRERLM